MFIREIQFLMSQMWFKDSLQFLPDNTGAAQHHSVKPTLDILHSLLCDGPFRRKKEMEMKYNFFHFTDT